MTTVFHYDFDGNIIGESDTSGSFSKEYLYRGSNRLVLVDVGTGALYYYGNDQLGTPHILTDCTNTVVWEAVYAPYGEADVNPNSTVVNNFRLPGQYYDAETGLHVNGFRHYDPGTGRYTQTDPIGLDGGINLFLYVQNNPVNYTDPLGLETYRCRKPLSKLGGRGERSGPDVPGNPLFHQYLCVEQNGVITCGGQTSQNGRPYGPGTPSNDTYNPANCEIIGNNPCIENCLLRRVNPSSTKVGKNLLFLAVIFL